MWNYFLTILQKLRWYSFCASDFCYRAYKWKVLLGVDLSEIIRQRSLFIAGISSLFYLLKRSRKALFILTDISTLVSSLMIR